MRLEIFEQANSGTWNEIIQNSPYGTISHTWEWLKIIEKYSKSKLFPLVFFDNDDDKPFGVFPLFFIRKLGIKMVFSPPPGSSITLGPALLDKDYKTHKKEMANLEFQYNIDKFIQNLGANYVGITASPGLLDIRPFSWSRYQVSPCFTYKIHLLQGKEAVWSAMSKHIRSNIKTGQNRGIKVIESHDIEDINYVYDAARQRYNEQHLNISLQKEYLKDLFKQFGKSGLKILLVVFDGQVVGGSLCTVYKDTFTAWIGGCRQDSNKLEVNELLVWDMIVRGIQEGYKWLEIMGANTRRLCDFKSAFSPELFIYFQIMRTDLLGSLAEKTYWIMKRRLN